MKFSVLMSVYKNDNPDFFEQALLSVTEEQILKPNQIVIVCDGAVSKDIENKIKEIESRNLEIEFSVIKKDKNQGLAVSLNIGLEYCKYEWIARMDSDDISTKDRFQKQIQYLKKHPGISALGGYISEFENNPENELSVRRVGISQEEILKMCKSRTPMNHDSVIYKKEDIITIGGYAENFGKLEDYRLWVDLLSANKILANIDDVIVKFRVGNAFIERRSDKREIEDWDMLQKYLLNAGLINPIEAIRNRIYIRVFIYTPSRIKKFLYKYILRSKIC